MTKAVVVLTFLISLFSHMAYSKIGILADTYQTATLKCFISQGISNFVYLTAFPPQ
jgi:hypothetical protein